MSMIQVNQQSLNQSSFAANNSSLSMDEDFMSAAAF